MYKSFPGSDLVRFRVIVKSRKTATGPLSVYYGLLACAGYREEVKDL